MPQKIRVLISNRAAFASEINLFEETDVLDKAVLKH